MILNLIRSIIGIKLASKMAKDLTTNTLSLRVKLLVLLLEIGVKLSLVLNVSPLIAR
jgi:predicted tellurium resistance membrane protein TerC